MKKYVLNIEKLYTGQTANALVLKQIDDDFPVLIPSLDKDDEDTFYSFARRIRDEINPDFKPEQTLGTQIHIGNRICDLYNHKREQFDLAQKFIVDFNLDLQTQFKEKGHHELYMMDDTRRVKPNAEDSTLASEKTYLHCLNGKANLNEQEDEEGENIVNSSQMNVIFPFKKMTSKSLYASQLKVETAKDIDDTLERSRGITLQGKVSYEDCLQGVTQVGNNLYMMSPNIDIGNASMTHIHGNGLTIVNGFDFPYHFPHSMTLFQPSQDQYDGQNLEKDENGGTTNFIDWYKKHNRRTIVSMKELYGGNVTDIKCLGPGSYELDLATYSPTDIVVVDPYGEQTWWKLNSETFRKIRSGEDLVNNYIDRKYVFDNCQEESETGKMSTVGILFNMYDTFITGNDRILKMKVPKDKDFNKLFLKFEWKVLHEVPGKMEAVVVVNENNVFEYVTGDSDSGSFSFPIQEAAVEDHGIEIVVRIHYDVDFGKRNTEHEYREKLKRSGVLLNNLRIENGVYAPLDKLTFGSYVNEDGITDEERERRYNEFWKVSQYKKDMTYQTVIETSVKNVATSGIKYLNNYSSGDLYGDMFVTKSILNPEYDMDITLGFFNELSKSWAEKDGTMMLRSKGRDYIGLGSCSDQLSLIYKPIDIAIGYEKRVDLDKNEYYDERVFARRVNPD